MVFGEEIVIDRTDFIEVVMSKRCNWLFDEQAIKNRFDIQMTISRRKEEKEKVMIEKANAEAIAALKAQFEANMETNDTN